MVIQHTDFHIPERKRQRERTSENGKDRVGRDRREKTKEEGNMNKMWEKKRMMILGKNVKHQTQNCGDQPNTELMSVTKKRKQAGQSNKGEERET